MTDVSAASTNRWIEAQHARAYLAHRDSIPFRAEGMAVLAEFVPAEVGRVLDLGTGDGILMGLLRDLRPAARGVACDFAEEMLGRAEARFAADEFVEVVRHDLDDPLPVGWGTFDLVVSSFAIHHLADARKQALYREVFDRLGPGGVFLNLEHVASVTPSLHDEFLAAIGTTPERDDPSNQLALVSDQLAWLQAIGFASVDCHWKWRELALLAGTKP